MKFGRQAQLNDEQRISRVTRAIEEDATLAQYVPKRIPTTPPVAPQTDDYAAVLEQVRALSVKAVTTYGNRVRDEVQEIVREHLETVLTLAARKQEIDAHYDSEMNALLRDTNDFTAHARRDLERLANLAPARDVSVTTEAIKQILDDELNGKEPKDIAE